ncbi:hypothetical protein SO802_032272 [Lithocarpus litseifolius]|uniref:Uncharacterized protein n=1 Tax=Lithocarpus litseifolius TaxID=425828 RepID=A0AAW2BMZ0_9ROSI
MELSHDKVRASLGTFEADASKLHVEGTSKSYPDIEEDIAGNLGSSEPIQENGVIQQKRAAKIHDFCFGIPYGGLVLSGGLLGFVFSRNLATLSTGVLFGGALLALSTFILKIWRQGKSSLPFILGQAALSAALLWKNFQSYSLCCNALLLLLCADLEREPTTKEIEVISKFCIMMRTPKSFSGSESQGRNSILNISPKSKGLTMRGFNEPKGPRDAQIML